MNTKFFPICAGIAVILFAAGFLIRSITTAHAAPSPQEFIDNDTGKIGKYQMSLAYSSLSDGGSAARILVWDTETGKSTYYKINPSDNGWKKGESQIPSNPLDE